MNDETTSAPADAHKPKPKLREILKESSAETLATIEHTHPVTGRLRQVVVGGLLGVCVVFVATMLSLPRLDTPLQVAVSAFVMAIVLLSLDFTYVSVKFGPGLNRLQKLLTRGIQIGAWIVFEGVGTLAMVVGIAAVVQHLSVQAFWVGVYTFAGAFLALIMVALLYALLTTWHEYKRQQKQRVETDESHPSEPAVIVAPTASSAPVAE